MVPALLLALACWRPDAYEPPAAPPEETEEPEPEEPGDDTPEAEAAPDAEGAVEGQAEGAPEEVEPPPFPTYAARTLQAPVTVVDDYGKTLAVWGAVGVVLEVTGEEAVRTRVSCTSCTPPVEGWIQAHLVTRTAPGPTGGSK
ncbi:MAG: hypothetical protein V4850_11425 [Myxococcota bacterium]